MADILPLHAEVREDTGKGAARRARTEGLVPGVIYGGGEDPQPITVKYNELFKMLKAGKFMSTLLDLKMKGVDQRVICRGVQRDPVKGLPTHIDLLRLKRTSRIKLFVPVEFLNEEECAGIRQGGVLTVVRNEVELEVTAGDIPDALTIDLTDYEVGDSFTIADIELPEGAKTVIQGRDFVIGNISAPSSLRSADDDADEADTEAAEGEEAAEGAGEDAGGEEAGGEE